MYKTYTVNYRRKRQGKTEYRNRLRLIQSKRTRLVIRKSNKNIIIQAVNYDQNGDKIVTMTNTKELQKLGWKGNTKNMSAAYLCGLLFGKKWKVKEILVPDIGQYTSVKGCKLYAVIKGVVDSGVKVAHSPEVFPSEDRIKGNHVVEFAKKIKQDKKQYEKLFSLYIKKGINPEDLTKNFEEVKKKILGV